MPRRIRSIALGLCRSRLGAFCVASVARWLPHAIPGLVAVRRDLVVMRHPVPVDSLHLLAVTRRGIPNAAREGVTVDAFWAGLESFLSEGHASQVAVGVTNLGSRQDVPLLHVHLLERVPDWASGAPLVENEALAGVLTQLRSDPRGRDLEFSTGSIAVVRRTGVWGAHLDRA